MLPPLHQQNAAKVSCQAKSTANAPAERGARTGLQSWYTTGARISRAVLLESEIERINSHIVDDADMAYRVVCTLHTFVYVCEYTSAALKVSTSMMPVSSSNSRSTVGITDAPPTQYHHLESSISLRPVRSPCELREGHLTDHGRAHRHPGTRAEYRRLKIFGFQCLISLLHDQACFSMSHNLWD